MGLYWTNFLEFLDSLGAKAVKFQPLLDGMDKTTAFILLIFVYIGDPDKITQGS